MMNWQPPLEITRFLKVVEIKEIAKLIWRGQIWHPNDQHIAPDFLVSNLSSRSLEKFFGREHIKRADAT